MLIIPRCDTIRTPLQLLLAPSMHRFPLSYSAGLCQRSAAPPPPLHAVPSKVKAAAQVSSALWNRFRQQPGAPPSSDPHALHDWHRGDRRDAQMVVQVRRSPQSWLIMLYSHVHACILVLTFFTMAGIVGNEGLMVVLVCCSLHC